MKSLTTYITEKMVYNKSNTNNIKYDYHPETKEELKDIIDKLVDEQSMEDVIDLNSIDTSEITDMSGLFHNFEGILKIDVSKWDVSNVDNTDSMFKGCINLEEIIGIEKWDVSSVENMQDMFRGCEKFNQDISKWNVSKVTNNSCMFFYCGIEEKYKPKFK